MIKFNKHFVSNGTLRARCWYTVDNRIDGRRCVSIYAKDYGHQLAQVITTAEYKNDTDISTDYFEKGKIVLFDDHPLYSEARKRALANER